MTEYKVGSLFAGVGGICLGFKNAKTTIEYCKKGDIIGVKGNIKSEISNDIRKMLLVAERVTFLSSKKADE